MLISGCAIKIQHQNAYESYYPQYHPGDVYALNQEMVTVSDEFASALGRAALSYYFFPFDFSKSNEEITMLMPSQYWVACKSNCDLQCKIDNSCNAESPLTDESDSCRRKNEVAKNRCNSECLITCMDDKYQSVSVSKHLSGGYYSDGSYYQHFPEDTTYFKNQHAEKDKYEKSKWQATRDKCMDITYQDTEKKTFESNESRVNRFQSHYIKCLKEKGYSFNEKT